jgi:hypothetical protein
VEEKITGFRQISVGISFCNEKTQNIFQKHKKIHIKFKILLTNIYEMLYNHTRYDKKIEARKTIVPEQFPERNGKRVFRRSDKNERHFYPLGCRRIFCKLSRNCGELSVFPKELLYETTAFRGFSFCQKIYDWRLS